jgi:hypothetical protein
MTRKSKLRKNKKIKSGKKSIKRKSVSNLSDSESVGFTSGANIEKRTKKRVFGLIRLKHRITNKINILVHNNVIISIEQYIENLYSLLRKLNMCCTSCAFVVEDPHERLWRMLRFTDKKNVSKFPGLTHNAFKTGSQYDRYILSMDEINKRKEDPKYYNQKIKSKCQCMKLYPENYQMICIDCRKKDTTGVNIANCKGIIKFYKFRYNGVVHVFMKLEKWRTIKTDEIMKHWKEYNNKQKMRALGIKRAHGPERVEDCKDKCENNYVNDYKDKNGEPISLCIAKRAGLGQKFLKRLGLTHSENNKEICYHIEEWSNRKGDEIFVPAFVNESILKNIIPTIKKNVTKSKNKNHSSQSHT